MANLLEREFMVYGEEALHYAEAAAAVGALRFAARAGNDEAVRALATRYAVLLEDDSGLLSRRAHVDMAVIGILPLEIAMQTGDEAMRALGLGFAEAQWAEPLPEGVTAQSRWWIDDLYIVGMLQIQAYRATATPATPIVPQHSWPPICHGCSRITGSSTTGRTRRSSGGAATAGWLPRWPKYCARCPETIPASRRSTSATSG